MTSKVILISTNRCTAPDPVFPLGLAYLNAALRRAGHKTEWLDLQESGCSLESVLKKEQPDFIGISLRNIDDVLVRKRETYFGELVSVCGIIRKLTEAPIILGGSGFSIFPDKLLEVSGADFGICGEGEKSLVMLIEALEAGGDPSTVPGLVFRRGEKIFVNRRDHLVLDYNPESADRPSRVAAHYLQAGGMLNLQSQRGCAFGCCYCTYPVIEGCGHRRRPAAAVAEEMELLQELGAKYLFIVDSVFNSSAEHVTETCEAIIRKKLQIQWGCFLRPQGLTSQLMKLMARAGLSHIEFGTDSFCDDVLEAYGKGFYFEDILQASSVAQAENVDYCHFLICGGPGETEQTLQTGFENARRLPGGVIMAVAGMRIYPGTALCARARKEGLIGEGTDLLNPVYYFAPGLNAESVFEQLHRFSRLAPNWIVGDPSPEYARLVQRLRQRRVMGPLWSYFSMIQRLWPQSPSGSAQQDQL